MQIANSKNCLVGEVRIVGKSRGDERTQAVARDGDEILQTVVSYQRRYWPENLHIVNIFCIEPTLARQKSRLHKCGFIDIGVQRLKVLVTAEKDFTFFFQLR